MQTPSTGTLVRKSAYNFSSVLNKSCLGQLPLRNWDLHAFLVIHVNITESNIKVRLHCCFFLPLRLNHVMECSRLLIRVNQRENRFELVFILVCSSCMELSCCSHCLHEDAALKTVHKAKNICK